MRIFGNGGRLSPLGGALVLFIPSLAFSQSAGQWKEPKQIFDKVCAYCHDKTHAIRLGPELMGRRLAPDYIIATARHGRGAMPGFPESHISRGELEGLAKLIRDSAPPAYAATHQPEGK